ncbi:MAG: trigger factor [Abditibacteriota bacterium]|nr:trigger factor [Abditibacteriota bacterium]
MTIINTEEFNEKCLTNIEIEISSEEFESSVKAAYKSAAKQINIPGFRKGKAPKFILKQYVEPKYIGEYAAEQFIEKNFDKIIELSGKKPFAQCSFDVIDYNDEEGTATIKFIIPTEPQVTLGDYKGIEVKKYHKDVTDEDVKAQLDEFILQKTRISPVLDRPCEKGDNVFADVKDNDDEEDKPKPQRFVLGEGIEDIDNAIIGMEQGDEKDVIASYPADYEDEKLAGKTKNYHIRVRTIYHNVPPEINEEFFAELFKGAPALPEGKEYPKNMDEYNVYAKEEMQKHFDKQFEDMFKDELLKKIVDNATVYYPDAIIDQRTKESFERFSNYVKGQGMKVEDYMKAYQLTPDMMVKEFRSREEAELKRSLVGSEIIKAEDIKATEEEIEASLKEKAEARNSTLEAFKEMVEKNSYYKTMIEDEIVSKKFMDFIIENAVVTEEEFDEEKAIAEQMANQIEENTEKEETEVKSEE